MNTIQIFQLSLPSWIIKNKSMSMSCNDFYSKGYVSTIYLCPIVKHYRNLIILCECANKCIETRKINYIHIQVSVYKNNLPHLVLTDREWNGFVCMYTLNEWDVWVFETNCIFYTCKCNNNCNMHFKLSICIIHIFIKSPLLLC